MTEEPMRGEEVDAIADQLEQAGLKNAHISSLVETGAVSMRQLCSPPSTTTNSTGLAAGQLHVILLTASAMGSLA